VSPRNSERFAYAIVFRDAVRNYIIHFIISCMHRLHPVS